MADTSLAQMFFDRSRVDGAAAAYLGRQGNAFTDVSWSQAASRVEAIAAGVLKGVALTPGACVTIMANTRLEWVLADWALLSLGFRTVPIYVSLLPPEIGYIHADTGAELLVVDTLNIIPAEEGLLQTRLTKLELDSLQAQARMNHPDLLKIGLKQRQLMFEERYQRDKLKPKLNLQYNLITKEPGNLVNPGSSSFYSNNYKFGVYFSYPLLLRKERGKIQQVEIKQSQL